MGLSIIVPTSGRGTLENTVASILHQLDPEDELIVVGARAPEQFPHPQGRFIHRSNGGIRENQLSVRTGKEPGHPSGAEERDLGDAQASGTHLLHCDDDDIFTRNAFADVRRGILAHPDSVLIYQMKYGTKGQWVSPYAVDVKGEPTLGVWEAVSMGNFGGMQMVFPHLKPNPLWYDGRNLAEDYHVTTRYIAILGDPVWPHVTIGIVRPTAEQIMEHTGRSMHPIYAPQPFWNGIQPMRMIPNIEAPRQTPEEWSYELLKGKEHPAWTVRKEEYLAKMKRLRGEL